MPAITVVFLGPARTFAGTEQVSIEVPQGATVGDVRELLSDKYPKLAGAITSMRLAINQSFASDKQLVREGDEIALIPPVSGGVTGESVLIRLTDSPICQETVRDFVSGDPAFGGIVTFVGATRDDTHITHGKLIRLEYEAYAGMAEDQMRRLANEAIERWQVGRVAIVHRTGVVAPGEASVVIAVACAHRREAFDACRWLIDTLKKDVPIWKRDVFADGHTNWVDPAKQSART